MNKYNTRKGMPQVKRQQSNNVQNHQKRKPGKKSEGKTKNKPVESKDGSCQTYFERKESSSQTDSDSSAVDVAEMKLLKLEHCTIKNDYDSLKEECALLHKNNTDLLKQVELTSKQIKLVDDIIETNNKLKTEVLDLRAQVSEAKKTEDLQMQIISLEEKLKDHSKVIEKNETLEVEITQLRRELEVANSTVSGLKKVLSMCDANDSGGNHLNVDRNQSVAGSDTTLFKENKNNNTSNRQYQTKWKGRGANSQGINSKWDQKPYRRNNTNNSNNPRQYKQSRVFFNNKFSNISNK